MGGAGELPATNAGTLGPANVAVVWTIRAHPHRNEAFMLAILAAVLFGLALLMELAGFGLGPVITTGTLTTAGLLCVALHLAGVATDRSRFTRRRRRR